MSRKKKTEEPAEEVMTLEAETPETIDETPEETEETPDDTPEDAQESEPTEAEPVAYIGPNIKHIVTSGTVFKNGLPVKLQKKIEDIPAIRGLLVPVNKLAESYKLVRTDGAALNNLYYTVAEKLKEG